MSSPKHAFALALWLSACSNQFEVLKPLPRVADHEPRTDAGADAARPLVDDIDAGRNPQAIDDAARTVSDAAQPGGDGSAPSVQARVVSAFAQTCAVRDGALYCWGADSSGQVGMPGNQSQLLPVQIDTARFIDVCAGELHSCALRADGAALCWGDNTHGQLGLGDLVARELPTELPTAVRWAALACGGHNTCALTPRGELYCWGENAEGRLGQGDPPAGTTGSLDDNDAPLAVRADLRFERVSLGQGHVCATSHDDALYCWGRNSEGQLGVSDTSAQQRAPVEVQHGTRYMHVAAGQRHTCAIDIAGKLFCWGQNGADLLGVANDASIVRTPLQVGDASDYTAVSASWFHSCALRGEGALSCWGRNEEGQLGLGDMTPRSAPSRSAPAQAFRSVAVGQFHTCAFGVESLSCWGANESGQLGLGNTARRYVPIAVTFP